MADLKKQIINWFNGPQDYNEGIELLQAVSKKRKVLGRLIKKGETKASIEKIIWELNKVAGLKKIPAARTVVKKVDDGFKKIDKNKTASGNKVQDAVRFNLLKKGDDINNLPPVIQRIVRENSYLYMNRGKKHKELTKLPDDNSKETIGKRVAIQEEIKKMSDRLEVLFIAWKEYNDNKTMPNEKKLFPEANEELLSVDELKATRQNIQSSITKDRNMLLFSSKTKPKDGKENPLPAGPKRTIIEKRIAKKEVEINTISQKIADLS